MLRPSVNQEWVDEGELSREQTKNWRRRRPEFIIRESVCNGDITRRRHGAADRGGIVRGNATQVIVSREGQDHTERRVFRVYASKLASDESLGRAVYHRGSMIGAVGELDCFSAHIRLREPDKSEDKAKSSMAVGRQIIVANSMQGVQTLIVLQKCEQSAGE
ncbi:hypothetical protein BHE74_00049503 [Ensete ventricosum]|nr:hypothetical protein BHE74_00049503 [Ensete ventricosum]